MTLCACGCGTETRIATRSDARKGWVTGQPYKFVHGHTLHISSRKRGPRKTQVKRYRSVQIDGQPMTLHRRRAEKALGHPLPPQAVVHHADGSRSDTAPLVICPNENYHKLLHRRMRVVALGGDPNQDKFCPTCERVKPHGAFARNRASSCGLAAQCKACRAIYDMSRQSKGAQVVA